MNIKLTDTGQAILALVPITLLLLASKPEHPLEPKQHITPEVSGAFEATNQVSHTLSMQ